MSDIEHQLFREGRKMQRFVNEFGHLLGKVPDKELARRAGYIHATVIGEIRNRLGVEVTRRGKVTMISTDPKLFLDSIKDLRDRYGVSKDVITRARRIARNVSPLETASISDLHNTPSLDGALSLYKDTVEDVSLKPVTLWDKIDGWLGFPFFGKIFRIGSAT